MERDERLKTDHVRNDYNIFCTNMGCFRGYRRDDIDNGWPNWEMTPLKIVSANATYQIGLPQYGKQGQLKAPPLWHYTIPQNQELQTSFCGPAGCGPIVIPSYSSFAYVKN